MPFNAQASFPEIGEVDVLSRRELIGGLAAVGISIAWPVTWAQSVSAAAEESKALPLPALGSVLKVPRLALLDGSVFDPEAAQGKALLVYWWASTCPFCALQSPSMEKLWVAHRGKGLQMVAISVDKKPEDASAYLKTKGYTFPAGWASPEFRKLFPKPKGLPITLLAGRGGKLLLAEKGQMFAEDVENIAALL